MLKFLILLLIIIPTLEIAVLVLSGNTIGIPWTLLLVIFTGVLGAWLAKKEGLQTIRLAQLQLQQGQIPSGVLLDGLCILVGGVVLLTPGFITDALGFFLLIPQTRAIAKAFLQKIFNSMIKNGSIVFINRR
ncbi:membrane protein FxsA [Anaerobacillus alkalidiazotrophicus]|uniref:Membrane protein FxsA n=1 Tax=Anaerobacillus alkalidiazotrophicus TaxID=472963 RepID=A0A1S2M0M9_9BACI|nr:FxsA family protein [Anaerobacillus alkalidiazotrophicus]OIJ18269.1 membrane protein FxsA [Anaerobacillus alkalidiazotrophicus]OIJ19748.1 membrane protein FxsA [Anaerobacillus alkalidiazotrophicus]